MSSTSATLVDPVAAPALLPDDEPERTLGGPIRTTSPTPLADTVEHTTSAPLSSDVENIETPPSGLVLDALPNADEMPHRVLGWTWYQLPVLFLTPDGLPVMLVSTQPPSRDGDRPRKNALDGARLIVCVNDDGVPTPQHLAHGMTRSTWSGVLDQLRPHPFAADCTTLQKARLHALMWRVQVFFKAYSERYKASTFDEDASSSNASTAAVLLRLSTPPPSITSKLSTTPDGRQWSQADDIVQPYRHAGEEGGAFEFRISNREIQVRRLLAEYEALQAKPHDDRRSLLVTLVGAKQPTTATRPTSSAVAPMPDKHITELLTRIHEKREQPNAKRNVIYHAVAHSGILGDIARLLPYDESKLLARTYRVLKEVLDATKGDEVCTKLHKYFADRPNLINRFVKHILEKPECVSSGAVESLMRCTGQFNQRICRHIAESPDTAKIVRVAGLEVDRGSDMKDARARGMIQFCVSITEYFDKGDLCIFFNNYTNGLIEPSNGTLSQLERHPLYLTTQTSEPCKLVNHAKKRWCSSPEPWELIVSTAGQRNNLPDARVIVRLAHIFGFERLGPPAILTRLASNLSRYKNKVPVPAAPPDGRRCDVQKDFRWRTRVDRIVSAMTGRDSRKLVGEVALILDTWRESHTWHAAATAGASGSGLDQSHAPPVQWVPQPEPAPLLMPPLQQPTQDDMEKQWGGELRKRVRFRTDCAKCTLARTDCHVRLNYTTASGSGKKRNPANNPACVEYRHVISTTRLADLLDGASSKKRKRFVEEFLRTEAGYPDTPLGTPAVAATDQRAAKQYKVTVYDTTTHGVFRPVNESGEVAAPGERVPQVYDVWPGLEIVDAASDDAGPLAEGGV